MAGYLCHANTRISSIMAQCRSNLRYWFQCWSLPINFGSIPLFWSEFITIGQWSRKSCNTQKKGYEKKTVPLGVLMLHKRYPLFQRGTIFILNNHLYIRRTSPWHRGTKLIHRSRISLLVSIRWPSNNCFENSYISGMKESSLTFQYELDFHWNKS